MRKLALRRALAAAAKKSQPKPQGGSSSTPSTASVSGTASKDAQAVAAMMVGQATGQAVQDATVYFQGVSAIALATIAKASEAMLIQEKTDPWTQIIEASQTSVNTAAETLAGVGTDAAAVLKAFE